MLRTIGITIILSILVTTLFFILPNKSNISDVFIVPFIVALVVKYIFGDWDKGSAYSWSDILYFLLIILVSILTLKLLQKINY